jgi:hypothetical protein
MRPCRRAPADTVWTVVDVANLRRGELIAAAGGLLLVVSLFVPWYDAGTPARIEGRTGGVSAWQAHPILRWLLLLAALAPFVLVWIIVRDHELSWARGEMTAVIAIAAFGLVVYNGILDRPGAPPSEIGLAVGWYLALLGTILMVVGGAMRAGELERSRRPPGVL